MATGSPEAREQSQTRMTYPSASGQSAPHPPPDRDLDPDLLPALADERRLIALPRIHLAAGELPPTGERGGLGALGGQHAPAGGHDHGCDDCSHRAGFCSFLSCSSTAGFCRGRVKPTRFWRAW
ncbi:hypothetical protein GCM10020001_032200 [Nonomuraea salmonea]